MQKLEHVLNLLHRLLPEVIRFFYSLNLRPCWILLKRIKKAKIVIIALMEAKKRHAWRWWGQFQNPKNQVSVFCISLKAGGTGLI